MLRKAITFNDLDGNPITEDFYFNFTKAELAELKLSTEGGLETYLAEIAAKTDQSQVIPAFKMILRKAVGQRHSDGRRFIKSEDIADYFMQTEAYSELFMELLTNPGRMSAFIEGCMPADLVAEARKQGAFTQLTGVTVVQDAPADVVTVDLDELKQESVVKTIHDYTEGELAALPIDEFRSLFAQEKSGSLPKNLITIAMRRSGE
jgi:hypothetical protein